MTDQPSLFEGGEFHPEIIEELNMTVMPGPIAKPSQVGFLAGMLAVWTLGDRSSKASQFQRDRFREIAREAITQAQQFAP